MWTDSGCPHWERTHGLVGAWAWDPVSGPPGVHRAWSTTLSLWVCSFHPFLTGPGIRVWWDEAGGTENFCPPPCPLAMALGSHAAVAPEVHSLNIAECTGHMVPPSRPAVLFSCISRFAEGPAHPSVGMSVQGWPGVSVLPRGLVG